MGTKMLAIALIPPVACGSRMGIFLVEKYASKPTEFLPVTTLNNNILCRYSRSF